MLLNTEVHNIKQNDMGFEVLWLSGLIGMFYRRSVFLKALFPTGTVGPRVGIFLSPLDTNDGFYLSHIPVPARGKNKERTAARRPRAGRTSIRDVIVMFK